MPFPSSSGSDGHLSEAEKNNPGRSRVTLLFSHYVFLPQFRATSVTLLSVVAFLPSHYH